MDQHGTKKAPSIEAHGGIKEIHGDIGVATKIKIKVARKQLDPCPILLGWNNFTEMDTYSCLVPVDYIA